MAGESTQVDLGLGWFEVIVRHAAPDGTVTEMTVHRMVVNPSNDKHLASWQVDHKYDDEEDEFLWKPPEKVLRSATHTGELHMRGVLMPGDDDGDVLYRFVTKPVPILCPECVQGKHRNCNGGAWDPATDSAAPCQCKDEAHG